MCYVSTRSRTSFTLLASLEHSIASRFPPPYHLISIILSPCFIIILLTPLRLTLPFPLPIFSFLTCLLL